MSEENNEIQLVESGEDAALDEDVVVPRWRPAAEPTCCGSGCLDCPF